MRKAIVIMVAYVVAIPVACIAVGAASLPFLKPGDFTVPAQAIIISLLCVFYVLCFAPFAVAAHLLLRRAFRDQRRVARGGLFAEG